MMYKLYIYDLLKKKSIHNYKDFFLRVNIIFLFLKNNAR